MTTLNDSSQPSPELGEMLGEKPPRKSLRALRLAKQSPLRRGRKMLRLSDEKKGELYKLWLNSKSFAATGDLIESVIDAQISLTAQMTNEQVEKEIRDIVVDIFSIGVWTEQGKNCPPLEDSVTEISALITTKVEEARREVEEEKIRAIETISACHQGDIEEARSELLNRIKKENPSEWAKHKNYWESLKEEVWHE